MMRSSNRVMCFPAGTMVTVKGYPFVLRDDVAVMGTPENFGEAMCDLAKAEQMQDQAMDGLKGDPSRVRQPNAETVAALHEALAAGGDYVADVGEQERLERAKQELAEDVLRLVNTGNISRNDMFVIACGYRLRGNQIKDMRAEITQLEAKVAELSRNQVGSVCVGAPNAETVAALQEALATGKGKVAPTQDNASAGDEDAPEPNPEQKLWFYDDLQRTGVKGHFYTAKAYDKDGVSFLSEINFQNGPVPENGVNGLTNEALLAILIHRTKILDERFPCEENKAAIDAMAYAKETFESRTKRRQAAGIEGKMVEQST